MTRSHFFFQLSRILSSLWFLPALFAAAALGVLLGAPFIAPFLPDEIGDTIGLTGVYDLLQVLANSLLAVSIFSLGIMASSLHAAASVGTPRARPLLMGDRAAQNAISTFIGGFIYAIVGIVGLSTSYYSSGAKALLFFVTCLVIFAVIVALIRWISRLSKLGDVTEVIRLVEDATRAALLDVARAPYFGGVPSEHTPVGGFPVTSESFGYVQAIDVGDLGKLADDLAVDLHLVAWPGSYVDPTRPLVISAQAVDEDASRRIRATFLIGRQRTFEADPRHGLIALSEIGSRALSPGVNDPGTAIDVISTSVRVLAEWSRAASKVQAEVRHRRLHVRPLDAADLLEDAFRWMARDGAGQLEVQIRIQRGLATLAVNDEERFGAAARALSQEALMRAEAAMTLPQDLERLRGVFRNELAHRSMDRPPGAGA